jgi:hypothetical protein
MLLLYAAFQLCRPAYLSSLQGSRYINVKMPAPTVIDIDSLVSGLKALDIKAAAADALQADLDAANEHIAKLEASLAETKTIPSTLTVYNKFTAAAPLLSLAGRTDVAELLAAKEVAKTAALLQDADLQAIKSTWLINADGKISYGDEEKETQGWRNAIALALVLLHNMSNDDLATFKAAAAAHPYLAAGKWPTGHNSLTDVYSSKLQKLEGMYDAIVEGKPSMFVYVKVAAFMIVGRVLL